MRFSILLFILVTIAVSKQQLQKEEEEDRRELLGIDGGITIACAVIALATIYYMDRSATHARIANEIAIIANDHARIANDHARVANEIAAAQLALETVAFNERAKAQVTNIDARTTYVYIQHSNPSDRWIPTGRPLRTEDSTARRLLASMDLIDKISDSGHQKKAAADSGTGACPADHLRLPVESIVDNGVTSYRVPDSMANLDTKGCSFWWGTYAKKFNLGPLAPPKCLENKLKAAQTVTQTATVKRKVATSDNKPGPAVMHSMGLDNGIGAATIYKEPTIYKDPGLVQGEAVQGRPVQAAQKVQNFPTWQLWGVMVIAAVLLLVTCFASSQQKEVDVYSPLKQNVDEF